MLRQAAAALLLLPVLAGCGGPDPQAPAGSPAPGIAVLMPAAGARITHPRLDVAILIPEEAPAPLAVSLNGENISRAFHPPYRRMRSLGGGAVSVARLDLSGRPAGEMTLTAAHPGSGSRTQTFRWEPPAARLDVSVTAAGIPSPARIFIEGQGSTPTPDLDTPGHADVDPRLRESRRAFEDTADGRLTLLVPPGRYRVTAGRGLEYGLAVAQVEAPAGTTPVNLELTHQVPTPGWIGADLHVHAAPSMDSFLPLGVRLEGYAAAGIEVLVASDHNRLTDYTTALGKMPPPGELVTLVGVEAGLRTPGGSAGHWTLFPFAPGDLAVRPWPLLRQGQPADLFTLFRDGGAGHRPGLAGGLIELNHPRGLMATPGGRVRGEEAAAWFSSAGFDPAAPIPAAGAPAGTPNAILHRVSAGSRLTNLDFHLLEVLNRFSLELYAEVRRDWLALLKAGVVRTATANSDSHHRVLTGPGFPRNLVRMPAGADSPAGFRQDAFLASLEVGHVQGTTGPVIDLTVDGAGPGGTVGMQGVHVTVRIQVRAADWIPVSQVRLFLGDQVVERWELTPLPGEVMRFSTEVRLPVLEDTFIFVEAGADPDAPGPAAGGAYALVAPGFAPLAFTNPVLVDAGGDGWSPAR